MFKIVMLLFVMVLLLSACDGIDKQSVTVNDKTIEVEKRSFKIACDTDKQLGIAYFRYDRGVASGILVGEYYDKFCGDVQ